MDLTKLRASFSDKAKVERFTRVLEDAKKLLEVSQKSPKRTKENQPSDRARIRIPGLGVLISDIEEYVSKPVAVPVLGGKKCRIAVVNYDEDPDKEAFHVAIANFLSIPKSVLKEAETHIFRFYKDLEEDFTSYRDDFKPIKSPAGIWKHVSLGSRPTVSRRAFGDKGIYVSLECSCEWEQEHGLQIVFKNGLRVNKVGPYDGNLTNSDAWGKRYENVIYKAHKG